MVTNTAHANVYRMPKLRSSVPERVSVKSHLGLAKPPQCDWQAQLFNDWATMWEFPKIRGPLFWGPYNKDPTIEGTILGSPYFQKLPCSA